MFPMVRKLVVPAPGRIDRGFAGRHFPVWPDYS